MTTQQTVRYKSSFGFIDLLFNLLIGVTLMFFLAFLLINPVAKKKDIDAKAEFLVIVNWPNKSSNDVDVWITDNYKHIVSFRARDRGLMHLDRDDLGRKNDTFMDGRGKIVQIFENREVISIRGMAERTYTVTVHLYMVDGMDDPVTPVSVELVKINPYKVLQTKKVILNYRGDEKHLFTFTVQDDGLVNVQETGKLIVNSEDVLSDIDPYYSNMSRDPYLGDEVTYGAGHHGR